MKRFRFVILLLLLPMLAAAQVGTVKVNPATGALVTPSAALFKSGNGLTIGTNVQAYDADLTTWAGITPSANVQTLLNAADYAAFRAALGLVIGTNVQAYDADLTLLAAVSPTTKGDLLAYTGTAWNRLAAGTNNYVLTADSSQTTGVKWAAASGGSAISTPGVAYVQTSGNGGSDGTGTVGNPALPYATFQAAYDAGARTLHFGRGTFGDLSTTGAVELWLGGEGEGATIIGDITTTGNLTVHDLGAWSFTGGSFVASGATIVVTHVSFHHADASGAAGAGGTLDPETDGQVGGAGGTVLLNDCRTATASLAVGGSGGGGFAAADSEVVTNGGAGGSGGSVAIRGGVIAAYPQSYGGNGGEAGYLLGNSRNGGDGGNAGVVLLQNVTFPAASSLPTAPAGGLGGAGAGGGTPGADGSAGTILQLGVASDTAFYTDLNP